MRLELRLDEPGRIAARVRLIRGAGAGSARPLARWTRVVAFTRAGPRVLRLPLTAVQQLRVPARGAFVLAIRLTATDAAGNRSGRTIRLRLRR